jgi:hypothetical protein
LKLSWVLPSFWMSAIEPDGHRRGGAWVAEATGWLDRSGYRSGTRAICRRYQLPRRNLGSGLTEGRLSRSGTVRISSYFRSPKSVFSTFGWFLLLALLDGMIRGHDSHRRHPRP